MFIPTAIEEAHTLGWDRFDVIIVSGDTYIDSPLMGASVIAHSLVDAGFRVGIIAQPDLNSAHDITRLGEPRLYWGISAGSVDSMVANYTALKKKRNSDDLTPGGVNNRRPDRSLIVYTNLIRRYYKDTAPVVLGGIEASLRRIAHYDFWSSSIRRSVLFDAKADILVYGMGEKTSVKLAQNIKDGKNLGSIRGICYKSPEITPGYIIIPSFEEVQKDADLFAESIMQLHNNADPLTAKGLIQQHGGRYLIHNPPAEHLTTAELDRIYEYPYERDVHPYYKKQGHTRALDTIQFSITTHRGCYGQCNFCAIHLHQGTTVLSRSCDSILREAQSFTRHGDFRGIIQDVGGPSANMYGIDCTAKSKKGTCSDKRCLYPSPCPSLRINHIAQIQLLRKLRSIKGVRRVFVTSGLRHDMVMADPECGEQYLEELVRFHVSGQLKLAPEHSEEKVLHLMGKPSWKILTAFKKLFDALNKKHKKNQYLTYYFIAAHPGCTEKDMQRLDTLIKRDLKLRPEQTQVFTPTPLSLSTLMYYSGKGPAGEKIFVERDPLKKEKQKRTITPGPKKS